MHFAIIQNHMRAYWTRAVRPSLAIVCLLAIFPGEIPAQQQPAEAVPNALNIVVVEGEGAQNYVRQRVQHEAVVRVEDEHQAPINGAVVVFTLPTEGATGEFGNGSKALTVVTGSSGQAATQGLRMNQIPGKTSIHVTASYKGLSARTIISEENVLPQGAKPYTPSKGGHGVLIAVLIIVGGAAAGGAVYATQRKSGSPASSSTIPTGPNPIGITPGTGTIGGAH